MPDEVDEPSTTSASADTNPVWSPNTKARFESKRFSEYYDPCQEAASKSLKCLHRNGGDKAMCSDYFQAYRDCKKEWMDARKEEKRLKRLKS